MDWLEESIYAKLRDELPERDEQDLAEIAQAVRKIFGESALRCATLLTGYVGYVEYCGNTEEALTELEKGFGPMNRRAVSALAQDINAKMAREIQLRHKRKAWRGVQARGQ